MTSPQVESLPTHRQVEQSCPTRRVCFASHARTRVRSTYYELQHDLEVSPTRQHGAAKPHRLRDERVRQSFYKYTVEDKRPLETKVGPHEASEA